MKHSNTVSFYTLGCKLNFSETSGIARQFEEEGYARIDFKEGADIVVVNTCSVTEQADKKCRQIVKQARRYSPNCFIAVIGCYAQLKPDEIANIDGVNIVLGAQEKFKLLEHIAAWNPNETETKVVREHIKITKEFVPSFSSNDRTRSFLKVQDGCDYFCSFCTIPLARGRSRSNSIEATLKTAEEALDSGAKEIVFTGVNIGDFGKGSEENFLDLITAMDQIPGNWRGRISSIEPDLLHNDIIDFVANSNHFAPHFHIPLQSGSDSILESMRRKYTVATYKSRVEKIKELMPNACIGADVIVGYPGETEAIFLETVELLKELPISYLHVFTYSERANTVAPRKEGSIPMEIRRERSKQLQILSAKKKRYFYEQQIKSTNTVLLEAEENNGEMYGFTENYLKVKMQYQPEWENQFKQVVVKSVNTDGSMAAELLVDEMVA